MQQNYPFQPRGASGTTPNSQATLSISSSVQQITLPPVPAEGCSMVVVVDGNSNVAWSFGASSGLTINNGMFQQSNTTQSYSLPGGVTQLSVIGSASAGIFRVNVGDGQ